MQPQSQNATSQQRARELEDLYRTRRGHAPQISISDDSHHVTEAIGNLYEDNEFSRRASRPLSFVGSPLGDNVESTTYFDQIRSSPPKASPPRTPITRTHSNERTSPSVNVNVNGNSTPPKMYRTGSLGQENGAVSPPQLNRTTSDTAQQHFPLNDIDYESSPAAVAQELNNLQALRRMSMDVHASDPDLPSFGSFRVPPSPPLHGADDEDPSRLFWVPARLHPELAPKEFKTFIEDKVKTIKRTSGGEESYLSSDGLSRENSGASSLRRKKSMLSRQIDSPAGYQDGADRLESKRSHSIRRGPEQPTVHELEDLVNDPSKLVQRVSLDNTRMSQESGSDVAANEDMPILPAAPGIQTLKRSTRTTYRRGSLRKGAQGGAAPLTFSQRVARGRHADPENEEFGRSPGSPVPTIPEAHLIRVQSEPIPSPGPPSPTTVENFSRPGRKPRPSPPLPSESGPSSEYAFESPEQQTTLAERRTSHPPRPFHSRIASNGRTTAPLPGYVPANVPQIIETPPPVEAPRTYGNVQHPERKSSKSSSHEPPRTQPPQGPLPSRPAPARPQRPVTNRPQSASGRAPDQTLNEMAQHPSPLPGHGAGTEALTTIPVYAEEKKSDKKSKKDDSRKTSWNWLLGGEDKEKEKKEREDKDVLKKSKSKLTKQQAGAHDNTRLDVLQHSIDGSKGRESVVIDRESIQLEEERQKVKRKTSGEPKKDKESGIFSSLFGGGKKKSEKESGSKKSSSLRGLSPEPPPRILKPDIDYNWTRFSILEERAIYRMAHIKLANPRRELYSQVLLSNFMYSYLAKVQQMHPQIQLPQSAVQKQQQREQQQQQKKLEQQQRQQQQQQQQQAEEFSQYQRYQMVRPGFKPSRILAYPV
ncbi:hypothetical protein K402DRAFT_216009 [Aulographum hederae CBS 113979]|uniref:Protein Zds1 C-terminal domain-containing protein n=1 Tax=Aulographum hederae CBS 113979 TaxID=1176131 RepID=A0A6G1GMC4_9PEZI|nr:hypothetical protein K402DRAFT_216009 [Aulographum hederae CBS 113979]